MPRPPVPPMTENDYHTCNQALQDMSRLIGELEIAKKGGAPCEEQIAACEQVQAAWEKWKAAYFPDRP